MTIRLPVTATAAVLVLAFAVPPDAAAQTPAPAPAPAPPQPRQSDNNAQTDTRALAETLFFTARGLIEAGRFTEACAKLSESYRLDAAAGTLLNLAVCNEKIGKIASAWGEFRDSVSEARRQNRPDREQLASERVKALEPELPFLTIKVPTEVRAITGFEITRNGIPLQAAAWDTDLPVDPGRVEVIERAPGYKPKTLFVNVTNKQHAILNTEPLELAPIVRPPPPFWTTRREIGVIVFGAGLVAAGVGSYFGVQAINDKKNSDNACQPDPAGGAVRCGQQGVNAMNNAITEAWVSDITIGVGAAAALAGVLLFVTGAPKESPGTAPGMIGKGWSWRHRPGPPQRRGPPPPSLSDGEGLRMLGHSAKMRIGAAAMAALGSLTLALAACQLIAGTESRDYNPNLSGCQVPGGAGPKVRVANFVPNKDAVDVCIRPTGGSYGEPILLNGGTRRARSTSGPRDRKQPSHQQRF